MKSRYLKYTGIVLLSIGTAAIIFAVLSDLIRGYSQIGFGVKQLYLLLFGILASLVGIGLITSRGRAYFLKWVKPGKNEVEPLTFKDWQDKLIKWTTIAMWFGIVTGLIESFYHMMEKSVLKHIVNLSQHFVWIVPVVFLSIFLIVGVILFLLNYLWPRVFTFQLSLVFFIVLALLGLNYLNPKLHILSVVILAIAISIQLSRIIIRRQTLFYEMVRATFPWLLVAVFSIAAFMIGYLE